LILHHLDARAYRKLDPTVSVMEATENSRDGTGSRSHVVSPTCAVCRLYPQYSPCERAFEIGSLGPSRTRVDLNVPAADLDETFDDLPLDRHDLCEEFIDVAVDSARIKNRSGRRSGPGSEA
jgi:hypothetical protein